MWASFVLTHYAKYEQWDALLEFVAVNGIGKGPGTEQ